MLKKQFLILFLLRTSYLSSMEQDDENSSLLSKYGQSKISNLELKLAPKYIVDSILDPQNIFDTNRLTELSEASKKIIESALYQDPKTWNVLKNYITTSKSTNIESKSEIKPFILSIDNKIIFITKHETNLWTIESDRLLKILTDQKSRINSAEVSSDSKLLVIGSNDETVKLWDINSGSLQVFEGHEDQVTSVSLSSNNQFIVSGSKDETAKIWDIQSGKCLDTLPHDTKVEAVKISRDCKFIITISPAKKKLINIARIWDVKTGYCLYTSNYSHKRFESIPLTNNELVIPNPSRLLYIRPEFNGITAKLINLEINKRNLKLKGHNELVTTLTVSEDGKYIVTGSMDKTSKMWTSESEKCLFTLQGHNHGITAVTISKDTKFIITCSQDKIIIWDRKSGNPLYTNEINIYYGNIYSVKISEDNRLIFIYYDELDTQMGGLIEFNGRWGFLGGKDSLHLKIKILKIDYPALENLVSEIQKKKMSLKSKLLNKISWS